MEFSNFHFNATQSVIQRLALICVPKWTTTQLPNNSPTITSSTHFEANATMNTQRAHEPAMADLQLESRENELRNAEQVFAGLPANIPATQLRIAEVDAVIARATREQAQLSVDEAKRKFIAAVMAPGPAPARCNADLPGAMDHPRRGLIVKRGSGDLMRADGEALRPLVQRAYEATGEVGKFPEHFGVRFVQDLFAGGWNSEMGGLGRPRVGFTV